MTARKGLRVGLVVLGLIAACLLLMLNWGGERDAAVSTASRVRDDSSELVESRPTLDAPEWPASDDDATSPTPERRAPPTPPVVAPSGSDVAVAVATATPKEPAKRVVGRVLQPDGATGAGGARVQWGIEAASFRMGSGPPPDFDRPRVVEADVEGRFAFDWPQAMDPRDIVFYVTHPAGALEESRKLASIVPGEEFTLVLAEGAAVSGHVVKPDGSGAAGIDVVALRRILTPAGFTEMASEVARTTSAGDGAFAFTDLIAGPTTLSARPGVESGLLGERDEPLGLVAGESRTGVVLRLSPTDDLEGIVQDADGQPIAGARVRLTTAERHLLDGPGGETTTDTDGRFVFRGLAQETPMGLSAWGEGYGSEFVQGVLALNNPHVIKLTPSRAILVTAKHADGTKVAKFRAELRKMTAEGYMGPAISQANSSDEGVARLERKPGTDFVVEVHEGAKMEMAPGEKRGTAKFDLTPGKDPFEVEVVIVARLVSGTVVDDTTGKPLAGVSLILKLDMDPTNNEFGPTDQAPRGHAKSGPDGRFDFANASPGRYSLECWSQTFWLPEPIRVTVPEDNDVTGLIVRVKPRATVRGVVLDEGGNPVVGAKMYTSGGFRGTTADNRQSGPDGRFVLKGLTPGVATISAHREETNDFAQAVVDLAPGEEKEVTVQFGSAVALRGRLTVNGRPGIAGFWTSAALYRSNVFIALLENRGEGQYETRVAPGTYTLKLSRNADSAEWHKAIVVASEPAGQVVDIALEAAYVDLAAGTDQLTSVPGKALTLWRRLADGRVTSTMLRDVALPMRAGPLLAGTYRFTNMASPSPSDAMLDSGWIEIGPGRPNVAVIMATGTPEK